MSDAPVVISTALMKARFSAIFNTVLRISKCERERYFPSRLLQRALHLLKGFAVEITNGASGLNLEEAYAGGVPKLLVTPLFWQGSMPMSETSPGD